MALVLVARWTLEGAAAAYIVKEVVVVVIELTVSKLLEELNKRVSDCKELDGTTILKLAS